MKMRRQTQTQSANSVDVLMISSMLAVIAAVIVPTVGYAAVENWDHISSYLVF